MAHVTGRPWCSAKREQQPHCDGMRARGEEQKTTTPTPGGWDGAGTVLGQRHGRAGRVRKPLSCTQRTVRSVRWKRLRPGLHKRLRAASQPGSPFGRWSGVSARQGMRRGRRCAVDCQKLSRHRHVTGRRRGVARPGWAAGRRVGGGGHVLLGHGCGGLEGHEEKAARHGRPSASRVCARTARWGRLLRSLVHDGIHTSPASPLGAQRLASVMHLLFRAHAACSASPRRPRRPAEWGRMVCASQTRASAPCPRRVESAGMYRRALPAMKLGPAPCNHSSRLLHIVVAVAVAAATSGLLTCRPWRPTGSIAAARCTTPRCPRPPCRRSPASLS
jgi:hypothetical protein